MYTLTYEHNPIWDIVSRLILLSPKLSTECLAYGITNKEDSVNGKFLGEVSWRESTHKDERWGMYLYFCVSRSGDSNPGNHHSKRWCSTEVVDVVCAQ